MKIYSLDRKKYLKEKEVLPFESVMLSEVTEEERTNNEVQNFWNRHDDYREDNIRIENLFKVTKELSLRGVPFIVDGVGKEHDLEDEDYDGNDLYLEADENMVSICHYQSGMWFHRLLVELGIIKERKVSTISKFSKKLSEKLEMHYYTNKRKEDNFFYSESDDELIKKLTLEIQSMLNEKHLKNIGFNIEDIKSKLSKKVLEILTNFEMEDKDEK